MSLCRLFAQCVRVYYPPKEQVEFYLSVSNLSDIPIILYNIRIVFDFQTYPINNEEFYVPPKTQESKNYYFVLPELGIGRKYFYIEYDLFYDNTNSRKKYGTFTSVDKKNYFIEISTKREIANSQYTLFISRGLSTEDRTIGDFIVNNIKRWNFITQTVGIEVQATDEQTSEKIKEEIQNANALIAIATPRKFDQLNKNWTTFDWLQSEFGIGYGIDKPLLIMQEDSVQLTALPKYSTTYGGAFLITFNRTNQLQIIGEINDFMPIFKKSIKTDRNDTFISNLVKNGILVAIGGLVVSLHLLDLWLLKVASRMQFILAL